MVVSKRGVELLSYELISEAFLSPHLDTAGPEHYTRLGAGPKLLKWVDTGLLSTMSRERHDPIRRLLLMALNFRSIEAQRNLVSETAHRMAGTWLGRERVDLVREFTEYYPIHVLSALVGFPPEDIQDFAEAAHELHLLAAVPMAPGLPRVETALTTLEAYVRALLDKRRVQPQKDLISALLAAQVEQQKLTEDELVGQLVNMIFAGMGTTTKQLAAAVGDIVTAGEWENLAANPGLITSAINESLRFSPVTQFVVRIAQDDFEFHGRDIPKGTRLLLNLLAASRDPEKFPHPDVFDITRVSDDSRLPFGWGVHRCLGQPLARLLIEEGLRMMLATMTDLRIVERDRGPHPAEMLGGPTSLLLTFGRR
ncbi:cytochrome P450 [Mycobacterium sp. 236(2023)]|uniref:cytochrome P450 n=1 Tax=Mycobacterium sp. 236(2023) TaxID=3038163 RepID=UPI00241588F0|nr:cytochrome P450 [Mycobacterium sp. 236(2023)]MDG4668052.1 cytochrome P450 [Mycobacterium sp. 236(2023)]